MKITILGAGTGLIRKESRSPSVLIESKGESILVDCGWGVPGALIDIDFALHTLDHLCITHSHADHMSAVPALLQSLVIGNIRHLPGVERSSPLKVHGYPGFGNDIATLTKMMVPELVVGKDIELFELGASNQTRFGAFTIETTEVQHVSTLRAVAYRISDGTHTVAISGDLRWDIAFAPVVQGVDLAVMDASMPIREFSNLKPDDTPSHLTAEQCGMWAAKGNVGRLVLTSLYGLDTPTELAVEVQKHYQGPLTIPRELEVIELV